ncbi:unnamed protein product [Arabis nemorensis]|uniref:Uncharacterized protein n=1 Tax=Arabis nemorensis TaxID=586526 RepID=A0A565BV71_9BRAS|nr:unnamed protein product [Arabis nemorensis]
MTRQENGKRERFSLASYLPDLFQSNPSIEIVNIQGDQLQSLVSKLVTYCTNAEVDSKVSSSKSSQLDLEPFPNMENFRVICESHIRICAACTFQRQALCTF